MYINESVQHKDLGKVWIGCMKDILEHGEHVMDDKESLLEIRNYYVTISQIDERDAILKTYANSERIALMKEKYTSCNVLKGYKISYGKLIYDNQGVNQVEWILNKLKEKPETKSATLTMHIPGQNELSCLSMLDFKMRNGKLDMSVVYRSQNVFASQPGNFIALSNIQKYLANELNVELGCVEAIILSAHIYDKNLTDVCNILEEFD